MKKLREALAKIAKRLRAREAEEDKASDKTHALSKEITALRRRIESEHREHVKTLKELKEEKDKPRPNPERVQWLERRAVEQTEEAERLRNGLESRIGKRSTWHKRRQKAKKRVAWWLRRQTTVRRKFKKAKKQWEKEHRLDFHPWMLNGCPEVHNKKLKEVIAFQVVVCDQYMTATSNGVHAPGSFHYDDKAVDTGSTRRTSMEEAAIKTREHFGREHFLELFSPCGWYIKYGVEYTGHFPGHGDHGHYAVDD